MTQDTTSINLDQARLHELCEELRKGNFDRMLTAIRTQPSWPQALTEKVYDAYKDVILHLQTSSVTRIWMSNMAAHVTSVRLAIPTLNQDLYRRLLPLDQQLAGRFYKGG